MFEAEVEMEKRSSILPMLLMLLLAVLIIGMVAYIVLQVRGNPIHAEEANRIVTAALQGPGPAVTKFHIGLVSTSADDKPDDPNYRLLEKAGTVKLAKAAKGSVPVSLTPEGERLLTGIPGFKKSEEKDGTFLCQVPLAQRQLVSIDGVHMNGARNATVEYTWKWLPNPLGDAFDAGGPMVKSFGTYERQNLINKYAADFYHGDPTKSTLALVREDRGWRVAGR